MSDKQEDRRSRSYRSFVGVAVLVLLALLATAGVKSYRDLAAVRGREADLERRISETETRIEVLSNYVQRIEDDPLTLERLAREELGLVKPGDVVIVLPKTEPAPPTP